MVAVIAFAVTACADDSATTTTASTVDAPVDAVTTTAPEPTVAESTTTTEFTGEITITPPDEIRTSSEFMVTWTGPNQGSDFITIVPFGADDGANTTFFNTEPGEEGVLLAPTEPGEYELRYVDGVTQATLYRVTVTVTE